MNLRFWILLLCAGLCVDTAHAAPTRSFVLDNQNSLSEGKLDGTAIESDGTIQSGVQTRRTELPGVPTAKSLLTLPDGTQVKFPLEGFAKYCLLNGVDELGFLLSKNEAIAAYERAHR